MRTLPAVSSILAASLVARVAAGEPEGRRELCRRGAPRHGAPIDLDVKGADLHDVFRLIADIGRVNIVVPDDVTGKVTLRLVRVAWDAAACAIAAMHRLTITVDGDILLVMPAPRAR